MKTFLASLVVAALAATASAETVELRPAVGGSQHQYVSTDRSARITFALVAPETFAWTTGYLSIGGTQYTCHPIPALPGPLQNVAYTNVYACVDAAIRTTGVLTLTESWFYDGVVHWTLISGTFER